MGNHKKQVPLWVANALVFLSLFVAVCGYFSWQIHEVKKSVLFHARQYADVVSKIVSLNAKGTIEAQQSIENILQNLLGNTARFVAYLDRIEPFSGDELTAFTRESGLAGISVIRYDNGKGEILPGEKLHQTTVQGPGKWFDNMPPINRSLKDPLMTHFPESHLYLLIWTEADYPGYIALGIKDGKIAAITESLGLNNIIKAISTVPGIRSIEINNSNAINVKKSSSKTEQNPAQNNIGQNRFMQTVSATPSIISHEGVDVARASQIVQGMEISVGVDAGLLSQSIRQLTIHFYLFSFFLIMAGIALSFVLHRYQNSVMNRVKQFERELASQRENATLGKSAAAIAHEIRNPLNALSMGLQRLKLENACSSMVHVTLLHQMSEAVKRANSSVTGLLNYARPRIPNIKIFAPEYLISDILNLYQKRCLSQGIDIQTDFQYHEKIESDPELMAQIIENIIKNGIEAQLDGGFIYISITHLGNMTHMPEVRRIKMSNRDSLVLMFKNGNCPIAPANVHLILEPYFTTRPEGTGLGMAIVRNIVKALDGEIQIEITESREISTTIYLPIKETLNVNSDC